MSRRSLAEGVATGSASVRWPARDAEIMTRKVTPEVSVSSAVCVCTTRLMAASGLDSGDLVADGCDGKALVALSIG